MKNRTKVTNSKQQLKTSTNHSIDMNMDWYTYLKDFLESNTHLIITASSASSSNNELNDFKPLTGTLITSSFWNITFLLSIVWSKKPSFCAITNIIRVSKFEIQSSEPSIRAWIEIDCWCVWVRKVDCERSLILYPPSPLWREVSLSYMSFK